jgi:probable rRNA maturation factor
MNTSSATRKAAEPACELHLQVQYACSDADLPSRQRLRTWAMRALQGRRAAADLVIRVVDEAESRALNARYRGKDCPTNVLAFPFEPPPQTANDYLGDLVICAPVVKREACEQGKPHSHHWAHMVVHGILHLCGYDHQSARQARQMETLERRLLGGMGIADPYRTAIEGKP